MRCVVIVLAALAVGGAGPTGQASDVPLLSYKSLPPGVIFPKRIGPLPQMQYPPVAIRCGMTGTATVELLVTAEGSVGEAKIISSTGYTLLDAASLSVLGQSQYSPATKDGIPIPVRIDVTQQWELRGRSSFSMSCSLPASAFTNGVPPDGSPDTVR